MIPRTTGRSFPFSDYAIWEIVSVAPFCIHPVNLPVQSVVIGLSLQWSSLHLHVKLPTVFVQVVFTFLQVVRHSLISERDSFSSVFDNAFKINKVFLSPLIDQQDLVCFITK
jgi:hypothetical protein